MFFMPGKQNIDGPFSQDRAMTMVQRRLTPELARRNPEMFKQRIIEQLHSETKFGGQAWDLLLSKGVVDKDSIVLDSDSWASETLADQNNANRTIIRLGIQSLPKGMAEQLIFLHDRFQGDKELLYRLNHEISHEVGAEATKLCPKTGRLFSTVIKMREYGQALSALGNLSFYEEKGTWVQANEDMVELVNMYLIDSEYLRKYLKFLSDPVFRKERQKIGLHTLPDDDRVINALFASLEKGILAFLNS